MRPCHRMHPSRRAPEAGAVQSRGETSKAGGSSRVNRYSHPIQVKGGTHSGGTDELLSHIQETLSRQAGLLEELLRRTEGEDTR